MCLKMESSIVLHIHHITFCMCRGLENKTGMKKTYFLFVSKINLYTVIFVLISSTFEIGKNSIHDWEKIPNFWEGKQPNIGGILTQKKSLWSLHGFYTKE